MSFPSYIQFLTSSLSNMSKALAFPRMPNDRCLVKMGIFYILIYILYIIFGKIYYLVLISSLELLCYKRFCIFWIKVCFENIFKCILKINRTFLWLFEYHVFSFFNYFCKTECLILMKSSLLISFIYYDPGAV